MAIPLRRRRRASRRGKPLPPRERRRWRARGRAGRRRRVAGRQNRDGSAIQTNNQSLLRLNNDILDIEKIESGQIVFNFRRFDVRALVEQVIEANRGYADG